LVPTARQNIVGFLKFSTTSSCGCKKLEEIPKKKKFPQSNPPKKNLFYFVIFEVLRNIIKIYYFFYFTSYAEMGPAARARLAASHLSPGPCADRASLP